MSVACVPSSLLSNRRITPTVSSDTSYDGDLSLPLGLALGSPIFPSGCEGKLGVALESLQGLRDLTQACVRDRLQSMGSLRVGHD